jgi:hypothetical protein
MPFLQPVLFRSLELVCDFQVPAWTRFYMIKKRAKTPRFSKNVFEVEINEKF